MIIRFFSVPIMVIAATFSIPRYMRSKVVTSLELCIDFLAYLVFLVRVVFSFSEISGIYTRV